MSALRFRLEQHAVAVYLAVTGLCFGLGLLLKDIARAAGGTPVKALAVEMRAHLEDSWNAAVGSTVALVAAGTGLVGSVFIDAATAVIS